jgi:hypothetical protein
MTLTKKILLGFIFVLGACSDSSDENTPPPSDNENTSVTIDGYAQITVTDAQPGTGEGNLTITGLTVDSDAFDPNANTTILVSGRVDGSDPEAAPILHEIHIVKNATSILSVTHIWGTNLDTSIQAITLCSVVTCTLTTLFPDINTIQFSSQGPSSLPNQSTLSGTIIFEE